MSAIGKAEQLLEAVVPQARGVKWAIYAAIAAIAILLLAFGGWWFFVRPRAAQAAAASARVEAATGTATAGAAQETLHIVVDNSRAIAAIDAITRENDRAILSAPGAAVAIDPALAAAGRRALCMRSAYRADPGCAALRGDGRGVGAAADDAGSRAAGE